MTPDTYGQKSVFFGTDNSTSRSSRDSHDDSMFFIDRDLIESFLQSYLDTVYHLHPFHSPADLRYMVAQLFNSPTSGLARKLGIIKSTIVVKVLAIGATMSEDCSWAEALAEKAKTMASAFDHVVNLQAVQVVLLLICLPFPADQIKFSADI
jgi:hypothetical protein